MTASFCTWMLLTRLIFEIFYDSQLSYYLSLALYPFIDGFFFKPNRSDCFRFFFISSSFILNIQWVLLSHSHIHNYFICICEYIYYTLLSNPSIVIVIFTINCFLFIFIFFCYFFQYFAREQKQLIKQSKILNQKTSISFRSFFFYLFLFPKPYHNFLENSFIPNPQAFSFFFFWLFNTQEPDKQVCQYWP